MNFIKKLVFKNEHNNEIQVLEFKAGTNIIIGPKGGGKSTLLNLIYAMFKKSKLPTDTKKALKEAGIIPQYIEYQNGDKTNFKELSNTSNHDEIITQTDDIKTRLNETKQIQEDRNHFVENLIGNQAAEIVDLFHDYFATFHRLYALRSENIAWNCMGELHNIVSDVNVAIMDRLDSDSKEITNHDKQWRDRHIKSIAMLELYVSINENHGTTEITDFIKQINQILSIHRALVQQEITTISIIDAIDKTGKDLKRYLKQKEDKKSNLQLFKTEALKLFENFAKVLAQNIVYFECIMQSHISFHVADQTETEYGLKISIKNQIDFDNDDGTISKILSSSLYKTKNNTTCWTNWLYASYEADSGPTKVKKDELTKHIVDSLKVKIDKKVQLLDANGKNYEDMSLGTRTSYGLSQKISNNKSSFLFLDQPEDGIDSFTIYSALNPLIRNKNAGEYQVFMVTHNANFGVNLDTNSVTMANFSTKDKPYDQIFNLTDQRKFHDLQNELDSPVAIFLEGGTVSLKERITKLMKKEYK